MMGLDEALASCQPDFVIVQGDTSTTFLGALAAFYRKIPVAHVEAGLRTRRKFQPYPEEVNRHLTAVLADAHLAPTARARDNLLQEGVAPEKIWITGNTGIDALLEVLSWNRPYSHPVLDRIEKEGLRMVLITSHRRENHGNPLENICFALLELASRNSDILIVFPVHLNPSVRDTVLTRLKAHPRIVLLEPLDYVEMVHFMNASHLILTDSGGVQEEAPALGKPVLVLRETTERPEGVESGVARVVGTRPAVILAAATELLQDGTHYRSISRGLNPYGDGQACHRIVGVLEFLCGRAERPESFRADLPTRQARSAL